MHILPTKLSFLKFQSLNWINSVVAKILYEIVHCALSFTWKVMCWLEHWIFIHPLESIFPHWLSTTLSKDSVRSNCWALKLGVAYKHVLQLRKFFSLCFMLSIQNQSPSCHDSDRVWLCMGMWRYGVETRAYLLWTCFGVLFYQVDIFSLIVNLMPNLATKFSSWQHFDAGLMFVMRSGSLGVILWWCQNQLTTAIDHWYF